MNLKDDTTLILASQSPRRKDLLEQLGLNIKICPSTVDESQITKTDPRDYASLLSEMKAVETAGRYPESWVLGADTIVVVGNDILGKPKTDTHALDMLKQLNNTEHIVYTAFCLMNKTFDKIIKQVVGTNVQFKHCTDDELNWYIGTKEPFDKAGAYAIQGKGAFMVKSITGSYSNVVGLPVCEVVEALTSVNLITFKG